jgi:hypothetical protein
MLSAAGLIMACAVPAGAQSAAVPAGQGFLNVNLGAQPNRRTITSSQSFSLYGETAKIDATQRVANGPVFEVAGGYRVRRLFSLGAGFSFFSSKGSAAMTAVIPNPIFFDRLATVSVTAADLKRSETGVHIRALWTIPVRDKINLSVSAGPSIIHVSQQIASGTVPANTQTLNSTFNEETGNAFGVNIGFDGAYMVTPRAGVGLFVQYAGGSVDLTDAKGVKAGGVQAGLGLRLRF